MGKNTHIEWCLHTFNHIRGCTKVSPGCAHCYAEAGSKRNPAVLGVWGPNGSRVVASESRWREPLAWDREAREAGERHRVFCASLADVFEAWDGPIVNSQRTVMHTTPEGVWTAGGSTLIGSRPLTLDDVRARLWETILATPNLDWLLLTKRPENVPAALGRMKAMRKAGGLNDGVLGAWIDGTHPPDNVWLGVSVEDQQRADERIPHLLRVPAAVRFLSCEPLLGPVDLAGIRMLLRGESFATVNAIHHKDGLNKGKPGAAVDWVIVGGESGPHARPMHPMWARSLRDQCVAAGVPYFFKQYGEWAPDPNDGTHWFESREDGEFFRLGKGCFAMEAGELMRRVGKKAAGRFLDGRTWDELPTPIAALAAEFIGAFMETLA